MLTIQENINLKQYASMALPALAKFFVVVENFEELLEALSVANEKNIPYIILGEGSNSLFIDDLDALIIKIDIQGIDVLESDSKSAIVYAAAGENWDSFVAYTIEQDLYGLENLSWIPGAVGAAPVQNIGAYGVELSDVLSWVDVLHIDSLQQQRLMLDECELGYRDSIFKNALQNKVVILGVAVKLSKAPTFKLQYSALKEALDKERELTLQHVRETVIAVRDSKLPNPQTLPNAGSFFKNPIIDLAQFNKLKAVHPSMPGYSIDDVHCKVPAAWLIDQAGWKGKCYPAVAVHDKQALVLVNHNHAHGDDLMLLAADIKQDVLVRYGINLEIEPKMYRCLG